jgi:hypothetical protein
MRCLAKAAAGEHHTKKEFLHKHALADFKHMLTLLIQAPCTSALTQELPFFRLISCALHKYELSTPEHWLL